MNKKRDSYYIIEAVNAWGRNGLANGWNYDNRFDVDDLTGRDTSYLYDDSDEKFYRLIRDFSPENSGLFRLELLIEVSSNENGVYVSFEDGKDNRLFGLKVTSGKWALFGEDTQITPVNVDENNTTVYAVEMNFDLEKQRMSAVINNVKCGSVALPKCTIERLVLGTNKVGKGNIFMYYARLSKNYSVNHHFLTCQSCVGEVPAEWHVSGDFVLSNIESMRMLDFTSVKADSKAKSVSNAVHSFDAVSGKFAFEVKILLPEKTDGMSVSLFCGNAEQIKFETKENGKIYVGDNMVNDYIANVWQTLHVEADTNAKTADIYVNGKKKVSVIFDANSIDSIKIGFAPKKDAVMWFDDVQLYTLCEHEDYPAAPKVAKFDYNIGMNVCWIWRDQQSGEGWDAVSPFFEFDTYMGYYDEGLRETADWEIKWMAEHGITFINACWYCPSSDVKAPIKEMRHSYAALHDGYMMAKYSDYVEFSIMWENDGKDCSSFEQFKEYIWNYWMEYYFTDKRYARIDNKAVLTVWNLENFVSSFGGEAKARKVVSFMDSELKKIGYDGILLLSALQSALTSEAYERLQKLGFSGTYGYHWGVNGKEASHQINCNTKCLENSTGKSHHIPTVSVGFNCVGRNESRNDIITADEHLEVCQSIKRSLSHLKTGTWKDNTVFISTWNEFSEGTYVLPTRSNGFSYLENIRHTFTEDISDHSKLDVKLTESQMERICHLYPPKHSPIRWLEYEKSSSQLRQEIDVSKLTSVKMYDMCNMKDASKWTRGNGLCSYSKANGVISGCSNLSDFWIWTGKKFLPFSADRVNLIHVRMKNDQLATCEVFFITDTDTEWSSEKRKAVGITKTDKFVDYYINMSSVKEWKGQITGLRIDPQNAAGNFEISHIELMSAPFADTNNIPKVIINGNELSFTFDPVLLDGDVLVCGEAKNKGFYSALHLYHEWDRFSENGILTLYTFNEKKVVFKVGSDKVNVDGKDLEPGFIFALRDGLPIFHIKKLCELIGYKYTLTNDCVEITV